MLIMTDKNWIMQNNKCYKKQKPTISCAIDIDINGILAKKELFLGICQHEHVYVYTNSMKFMWFDATVSRRLSISAESSQ